mmetsp:Transcript_91209/g.262622  ORF Transcript_91209/g.262622 Transcript_91209/m.262622 type:complete len:83 (-) Transcript_91209:2177-2425(-)
MRLVLETLSLFRTANPFHSLEELLPTVGTGIAMGQDDGGTEDHVHVAMTDVSAENDWILVCGRERIKRYQRSSCPSHNRLMI